MIQHFDLLGFFSITLVLFMQWQIYISRIATTFAVSSLLIGAAFVFEGIHAGELPTIMLGVLTAAIRGLVIPLVIVRSLHAKPHRAREHAPAVPTATSIVVSLGLVLGSYILYALLLAPDIGPAADFLPFALLLQGGFLIVSRRHAFAQLTGYLVMENAVLLLGSMVVPGLPFIVEAGVILDLLGLVAVSRIIMRLRESSVEENGYHREELAG